MTSRARLAIALGIALAAAVFIAANAHLIYVAVTTQPACIPADPALPPARKLC